MKKILIAIAAVVSFNLAIAQSADRTSAIMAFKDAAKAMGDQNMEKAKKSLLEAKTYIDKSLSAAPDDPKALYYKGDIYTTFSGIYAMDMANSPYKEAELEKILMDGMEAYKQSLLKKTKKEDFTEEINAKMNMGRAQSFNMGSEMFNKKDYEKAADAYQGAIMMWDVLGKADTVAYYNQGLCYEKLKKNEEAVKNFQKCISLGYGGAELYSMVYADLKALGKSDEALKFLQEGRAKFPKDQALVISEVNYYLGKGENENAEKAINAAIAGDPKNPTLYFALGSVYDNLKLYEKAEQSYKKAIEIDANYFDAYYNLGVMKYNEAAEMMKKVNDIADAAEYEREKKKADETFKAALPYLEKARTLNPKDRDNLTMLKNIYVRSGDKAKAEEIKALLQN